MKTLYLVRHAKAVNRNKPIPDFVRPLSKRGRQDAATMARRLPDLGAIPDVMVSSPAPRALETAEIFAAAWRYPKARILTCAALYDAGGEEGLSALLAVIHNLDATCHTAMIVGHEPLWSAMAHFLAPSFTEWIPTGGIVCLRVATTDWAQVEGGSSVVSWFHSPKADFPFPLHGSNPASDDQTLVFEPASPFDSDQLITALGQTYTVLADPSHRAPYTYYDTFDWRLFNKALTLACTPTHATLQELGDESLVAQAELTTPPAFSADFPDGDLQTRLAPLLGIRALRPLFTLSTQSQTLRILDRNAKTVVRLAVDHHQLQRNNTTLPLLTRVCLKPVRGYPKAATKLRRWLLQHHFSPLPGSLYTTALTAIGKTPNDYTSKPQFHFEPNQPAAAAIQELFRFLYQVMRQNEPGVLEDLDTEYLHDFRVALRRTRSALSQLKSVFPIRDTERFKRDFAVLATMTGPLRDLDVYLLAQDLYKAKLPPHLRSDIDPLFASLRQQRAKAYKALVRNLKSKKYATIMTAWEAFLDMPPDSTDTGRLATQPILQVARKRIRKRHRAVIQLGTQLTQHVDDDLMHDLRIECKKLRYLLEFFASLFAEDDITPLIKQLRRLQDNLGDFHDACVQQDSLHTFAEDWMSTTPESRRTLRAIDSLIGLLESDKQTFREDFARLFNAFAASTPANWPG